MSGGWDRVTRWAGLRNNESSAEKETGMEQMPEDAMDGVMEAEGLWSMWKRAWKVMRTRRLKAPS